MPNTREKERLTNIVCEAMEDGCIGHCNYPPCFRVECVVNALIANGVTVQEWIPVTERLPEEDGDYLAYFGEYDGICVVYYEVLKTKSKWCCKWKEVTHWMPLPPAPKGE